VPSTRKQQAKLNTCRSGFSKDIMGYEVIKYEKQDPQGRGHGQKINRTGCNH
jgi:hypothetical protein